MKYPRPPYLDPSVKTETGRILFTNIDVEMPKIDFPITPLENFKRAAERNNPLWVPNILTDFQNIYLRDICIGPPIGFDLTRDLTVDHDFTDWFNIEWTWVASAGGPMLKPGTKLIDDILNWERDVKFPNLDDWDWITPQKDFMENKYDPTKVLHINIGQCLTERLVGILGGYTEAMLALAEEPEAVIGFLNAYADFLIKVVDLIFDLYPIDMLTYHDDWGTERDTFFSERMMEDIVFEPSKRLIDHIKSKGCIFQLHSCGAITRFVPYMIDLGIDFIQIQRRAVDIPGLKAKYGDKIGINSRLEGDEAGLTFPKEEYIKMIHESVDLYASGGGYYTGTGGATPDAIWDCIYELYCYSREFYDNERGE